MNDRVSVMNVGGVFVTVVFTKVESSSITHISQEIKSDFIFVEFKGGTMYAYKNVTQDTLDEIISADSVGKAFNRLVKSKPGEYPFERL